MPPVQANTFRFFGSGGAEAQLTPPNESSPLNPGNVIDLPRNTNVADITAFAEAVDDGHVWKARLKVRADSSDRGSDQLRAGEAFVQLSARKWLDVAAGRIIEKWGTGYAWNPTAFVGPLKNPADPSDRRSAYRGIDMLKADLFARGTNISLYAMQHRAVAARVYRLINDTDVSILFRTDRDATREGLSIARVFGQALELHGEVAYTNHQRAFSRALPAIRPETNGATDVLVGGQYTFPRNVNVVVELYRGGGGLTSSEWNTFRSSLAGGMSVDPRNALQDANALFTPLHMGRNYSFVRVDVPWSSQTNDLELIAITNLRDRSSLLRATYTRKLGNISLYAIDTEFTGRRQSEFGYVQIDRSLTAGLRAYF